MPTREERIEGGLIGLLVGDALGVPYEFHGPNDLPALEKIEFDPPPGFHRAHAGTPPGTWSDDGAQALTLLASLLECGKLNAEDFGRKLVAWYSHGYLAVDGRVFDVGVQTDDAIGRLQRGVPALDAGGTDEYENGNGSLMRVLPLALWHGGADEDLVAAAHTQSRVTHGHLRSQVCCALYCLWARLILNETTESLSDAWMQAVAKLRRIYGSDSAETIEMETHIRPEAPPNGNGKGYVVDCLNSARWALLGDSFEEVVKRAVSLGHDTDTTACVAGGIAGIRYGIKGIPMRWQLRLRGRNLLHPLLEKLLGW